MHNLIPTVGQVLEALRDEFVYPEVEPLGGRVSTVEHRPGADVALDGLFEGDCDGLVWANVLRAFRTTAWPSESENLTPCQGVPAALIQLGAARCVATLDDNGYAPDANAMEHDALVGLDDAQRLDRAACIAAARAEEHGFILSSTRSGIEPIGPQGGVLAWVVTLNVQLA